MFSARYAKIQQVEEKNSKREDIGFSGKMTPRFQLTKAQRLLLLIGVLALSAAVCPPSYAQFNSNAGSIVLRATMAEAFSVTVTGGGTVNFTLAPNAAANPGSTTTTIQTAWTLRPGRTRVSVWAWVPDGNAALTDGAGDNIPASAVTAAAAGSGMPGGALNAVASGGAGVPAFITPATATGVQIGEIHVTGANKTGSMTTTLTWNINTTVVPQLPAASYTGTVNIQAQATP